MFRSDYKTDKILELMKGNNEARFFKEIPDDLNVSINSNLNYLNINRDMVIPEITIRKATRDERIVIPHPEGDDFLMRILVNLGPDDNFRVSREVRKNLMSFEEFTLLKNNGIALYEQFNKHHIVLNSNSRKQILRGGRKVSILRRNDHVSLVMVITLWVNSEYRPSSLNTGPVGPVSITPDHDFAPAPVTGIIERI